VVPSGSVRVRHERCLSKHMLVKVWVILDRPPNDPFLRKKEPFTSSFLPSSYGEAGARRRPVLHNHMSMHVYGVTAPSDKSERGLTFT